LYLHIKAVALLSINSACFIWRFAKPCSHLWAQASLRLGQAWHVDAMQTAVIFDI